MSKHDEGRRAFLIGAAVGAGAATGLVPDAVAQTHPQHPAADSSATTAQAHPHGPGHGAFFNDDDSATVVAFVERVIPGAPGKPGAKDAGVLNYIDLALSGAYADLQYFYRCGLGALDGYCRKTYNVPFAKLEAAKQDEVLGALEYGFTMKPSKYSSKKTSGSRGGSLSSGAPRAPSLRDDRSNG